MKSLDELLRMSPADFAAWGRRIGDDSAARLLTDWSWWRRADQCPPAGDWHVWMLLAGRGFGKTRTGAEWVRDYAEAHPGARIALVAASLHEARQVMVEGESGVLAIAPDAARPEYESSLRRLSWANGTVATLYSAAEPDSLRGSSSYASLPDDRPDRPFPCGGSVGSCRHHNPPPNGGRLQDRPPRQGLAGGRRSTWSSASRRSDVGGADSLRFSWIISSRGRRWPKKGATLARSRSNGIARGCHHGYWWREPLNRPAWFPSRNNP
ncbi:MULTISPECIES: terminase large subunit domain-containing protein [unclassified Sphingopyxis]|uniref:terminase large subunit domain-containing protein n=1 Tax=unclassified Sphingopyxis TaxID=2614943 RepID=UPI000AF605E2